MSRARSPSIAKPKSNPNTATKQWSNQANTSNQPHEYSWYSRDAQYANELRYLVSLSKIVTKRNELKLNRAKPEVNCSHRVNTTKRHTAAVTNMAEWPSKSKARANWERHLVTNRHIYDVVKNVFLNAHTHTRNIYGLQRIMDSIGNVSVNVVWGPGWYVSVLLFDGSLLCNIHLHAFNKCKLLSVWRDLLYVFVPSPDVFGLCAKRTVVPAPATTKRSTINVTNFQANSICHCIVSGNRFGVFEFVFVLVLIVQTHSMFVLL